MGTRTRLEGYVEDEHLPVKKGDRVTIPKGTPVRHRGKTKPAGRTYTVVVDHTLNGMNAHRSYHGEQVRGTPPTVRWPGTGGYWAEVDINDIEWPAP